MHKQGRGGEALGISLTSGVIGGLIGLIFLVGLTESLAKVALMFTPPAYFAHGILRISVIASPSEGPLLKGLMAGVIGLMYPPGGPHPPHGGRPFSYRRQPAG